MIQIALPDEIASNLASAAAIRGCRQEVLASMLIEDGLTRLRSEEDFQLTPEQEDLLLQRIAQSERGEFIDGEIVMARFETALQEMASRASE